MKRLQREQGFSLLETLIALTLFAAGVMAVMKLFPMSLRQAQGAAERTVAAQLADSKFGTLRTEGYARVAPNAGRYMQDAASDLSIPPALRFTISSIEQ
ncbi:MAG TPA: prepilin-type N-terminal cleavage/methylation domain-containing protein, partial [Candidatus Hydrogenedentes bacterium]|nr:prepilin-type N-terminal cleavage/methylation domain-containing protein [Candidatus Hydrogenedentota bacterium]